MSDGYFTKYNKSNIDLPLKEEREVIKKSSCNVFYKLESKKEIDENLINKELSSLLDHNVTNNHNIEGRNKITKVSRKKEKTEKINIDITNILEKPVNNNVVNIILGNKQKSNNKKIKTQKDLIQLALDHNQHIISIYHNIADKIKSSNKFNYINNSNDMNHENLISKQHIKNNYTSMLCNKELQYGMILLYENLYKLGYSCDSFMEKFSLNED